MASGTKRKRIVLSLKQKLEIVHRLDKGEKLTALAKEYNVGKSSVLDIKMRKDSLLKYVSAFANADNMNMRKTMKTSYNKELDQAVFEWYLNHTKKGEILSGPDICNKALEINKNINGSSIFKASCGWLKNFKYRHGIIPGAGTTSNGQVGGNYLIEKMTKSFDNIRRHSIPLDGASQETQPRKKRKHIMLSLKDKLDIITRLHKGEVAANLAKEYNIGKSTVNDIKMKQDALLNYVSSFPNSNNIQQRKTMKSAFNKSLDQAVYKWYHESLIKGVSVSEPAICDKALNLNKEIGGDPEFKASLGWLQNFKTRHGFHVSFSNDGHNSIDACTDIRIKEENVSSSESESSIYFPNCDVILNVPDENSISYANTNENNISCNDNDVSHDDTFMQTPDSDKILHAFKTVINWTEKQKECSSADMINLLKLHELAYMKGMSVAFSSDDSEAINRKVDTNNEEKRDKSISVEEMFEIDNCVEWIKNYNFSKIALQFPDSMLSDAMTVSLKLGEMTEKQVFVLGDTSYGSCCVDEIAAEHVSADAVIHFGHSCLSPTKRLPVLYVLGKQVIDIEDAANAFRNMFPDKKSPVILLYEVMYSYAIDSLAEKLKEYENLFVSQLEIPDKYVKLFRPSADNPKEIFTKLHRLFFIPSKLSLNDCKVFYVGSRAVTITNFMLTLKDCLFHSYNPLLKISQVETLDVNKHLKRRYYYIERAKDANIIGILVGTVGVSEYLSVITHLKELIKQSGKKSYTLVVGKLNSAKLANFAEIEIFVNVACSESSLIESKDFYQPIITPHELEIALNQARTWTGDYVADFTELLPGAASYVSSKQNTEIESDVSLVTGKIRHVGLTTLSKADGDSTTLVTRNDMKISAIHSNAAGEILANKSWKGLEQHLGETPVAEIEEGSKGIASKYEDETDEDSKMQNN